MAPNSAILRAATSSRSIVEAPGTTCGAMALWTWRRALPEIRIFSISCGVLIMIAMESALSPMVAQGPQRSDDTIGYLLNGFCPIDLAETAARSVVIDHWGRKGVVGLHALNKSPLGIVRAMLERSSIHIADALLQRRIGIDIVDALAGRTDAAASNAPEQLRLINVNVHRNQRRHIAAGGELGGARGSQRGG